LALNLQTFRTRTLTAVLFAAVMLVGLLLNFWSFLILFTIIHIGCLLEYLKLIEKIYSTRLNLFVKFFYVFYGLGFMLIFGLSRNTFYSNIVLPGISINIIAVYLLLLIYAIVVFVVSQVLYRSVSFWYAQRRSSLGLIYIALPITLFLNLRNSHISSDFGKIITCGIIFSIWINDTMAYIVGSLIGKTPFSKISPKKTWEGTVGGAILCVVVIALLGYFIPVAKVISVKDWIAIAAICAVFGSLGDLLESKIKRMADVKDSGSFMPGHGGFLDRFDSLLVATPFVWLYVMLFL